MIDGNGDRSREKKSQKRQKNHGTFVTDTPNFYFFNKKKSSVTAFILDLSINGIFEAWKILVAEKEIILAQEYRLFLIRLPIYMGKMALTQKSAIIGRFSRMSNSDIGTVPERYRVE